MNPKSELFIFNKKEVFIILTLLVLVALLSFTLGLRMGKSLGVLSQTPGDIAPINENHGHDASAEHEANDAIKKEESTHKNEHENTAEHTHNPASASHGQSEATAKKIESSNSAQNKADEEFASETKTENLAHTKPLHMTLPAEKKAALQNDSSYTLQVGSHRTVAEATEQVTELKRNSLEAFYIEAKIPNKGTWYRVGVGLFPNKEEAEKNASKWKAAKVLPPYIIQKINE